MKWLFLILGLLVAAVAVVVIIGAMLPKNHVATRSARLRQPPEAVWAVITDFPAQPSWRTQLQAVERLPDSKGNAVWRETEKGGDALTLETVEWAPPRRIVRRIADAGLPFGGTWTYEIAPAGSGCTVTITENGEVYNPVFRFVSRFLMGHSSGIETYLKALGRKFGEEVRFD